MSTSESELADIRYQQYELPPSLGKNPSEDTLKAYFNSYGWVYVCKIINETSNNITFYSPYNKEKGRGEISPGKQESQNSKGYIPYSSSDLQYEIKYYNTSLKMWSQISITDLGHDWLLSFKQAGVDIDEREVRPYSGFTAEITLIINDSGYKIYGCSFKNIQSSLALYRTGPR